MFYLSRKATNLFLLFGLGGCANAWRDFADKSSDSYLVTRAKSSLDSYNFDDAIAAITPVLANYPQNEDVAYIATAAYAGRAGLRILDLFLALGQDLSTKTLLTIFAEHFSDVTDSKVADMESAVAALEGYGARAVNRSPDMNFFALFVYYSRIGIILNRYAFDQTTHALDPNFTACQTTVNPGIKTGIPDTMVDRVMTSIPRILDSISGVASSGGVFDSLKDSAIFPAGLSFDPIPCSTNSNQVACLAARTFINVGDNGGGIGLGSADNLGTFPESPGGVCATTSHNP